VAAVGRIALVGDAAFMARPLTAASTAKAAGNELALVDALKRETDRTRTARQRRAHRQVGGSPNFSDTRFTSQ